MNWYEEGCESEEKAAKGKDSETHIRFIFANIPYLSQII